MVLQTKHLPFEYPHQYCHIRAQLKQKSDSLIRTGDPASPSHLSLSYN